MQAHFVRTWVSSACLVVAFVACARSPWSREIEEAQAPEEGFVTPKRVASTPEDDISPSASRDGRFLAFASEQNGNLDVWIRDQRVSSTYPLTRHSAEDFDPAISPDARRIAFVSRREDAKGDIFIKPLDDSSDDGLRPLTGPETYDRQPAWSFDGRLLYFSSTPAVGLESIHAIELETRRMRRVSPTSGFDPAPCPDPRFLIYTAARDGAAHPHPRLVALRLADSATRALTAGDAPEGFGRFQPGIGPAGQLTLVYVRFPDDDDQNGVLDARDRASLWRLDFPSGLESFFLSSPPSLPTPIPLTDGSADELFPDVSGDFVYFTEGDRQQDILRLPLSGRFPAYADPKQYLALAELSGDLRTRWFVYRRMLAVTPPGSLMHGQALLRIGNVQLERSRTDLARTAFSDLAGELSSAATGSPEAELAGIAEVEIASLDRRLRIEQASTPVDRERALRTTERGLESIARRYAFAPRVRARVSLELAEVMLDRGDTPRAIDALERVAEEHAGVPFVAAKAMLRRIELLGVAHDPDALGEAYVQVLRRFPDEREAVAAASDRIVRAQVEGLASGLPWRGQADAIRRMIPRFPGSPVARTSRWMLVELFTSKGALDEAALELQRLVLEAGDDHVQAARALERLAMVDEERGRLDAALESWRRLRGAYVELPGVAADARDAITRVGTLRAREEEAKGNKEAARAAYKEIIDNDLTQVNAHRRYFALSRETGELEPAIAEARTRAERSPLTPMARYAYGLSLTWRSPPALDQALVELDRAIALNPRFVHAYITRGWIREMKELERPGWVENAARSIVRGFETALTSVIPFKLTESDWLELALEDYERALRLNSESEDPQTELEIMLDKANAQYRLADKTFDKGGFEAALSTYVECLNANLRPETPLAELVFFERLGRAAAWNEEWALSVMATRRALAIAQKIGEPTRVAQLYGTLSLAYDQAGEDAYAHAALESSEARLEARKLEAQLVVAKRNRAQVKLATLDARTPEILDSALSDLASARALAEETEIGHADAPVWLATTPDASSAQYGFGALAERDVNLALAATAHRAHGETSRAEAIQARRRMLTAEMEDSVGKLFFVLRREPLTLLSIRERLGLELEQAKSELRGGRTARALDLLAGIEARLERLANDPNHANDRTSILADLGRVVALSAELSTLLPPPPGRAAPPLREVEAKLDRTLAMLEATRTTSSGMDRAESDAELALAELLPSTLSSTHAIAQTASIALSPPRLARGVSEIACARARLSLARGLLRFEGPGGSPTADLRGVLVALDARLKDMASARAFFDRAARLAASAGPGLGARLFIEALDALARVSRLLDGRDQSFAHFASATAVEVARAVGSDGLALRLELEHALRGDDDALARGVDELKRTIPSELGEARVLTNLVLARSASVALVRGDVVRAFELADRRMLLETAARTRVGLEGSADPADRELGRKLGIALEGLTVAQRARRDREVPTPTEVFDADGRRLLAAKRTIATLRDAPASDAAKARLFAEPILVDLLIESLRPKEALLVALPIAEELRLFLVLGSTTAASAESRITSLRSPVRVSALEVALLESRRALEHDRSEPPEASRILRAALVDPIAARLEGVETLFLADALVGGPAPASILGQGGPVLVHVSAPTAFASARAAELVGARGVVVLRASSGASLVDGDVSLAKDEAIQFRFRATRPDGADVRRRLEDRPKAERLTERSARVLVIEAPVRLEPDALERSAVALGEAPKVRDSAWRRDEAPKGEPDESEDLEADDQDDARTRLDREPDRFQSELPLESIAVPATTLVLARVEQERLGYGSRRSNPSDLLRLDLVAALRGQASVVTVPDAVPDDVRGRVLRSFSADAPKLGAARALSLAVAEELPTHPSALLISLLGSPGLDEAAQKTRALEGLGAAQRRATTALNKGEFVAAVPMLSRWIRLMREAGEEKNLTAAYGALVGILAERLVPPAYARAADEQAELVQHLESRPATSANRRAALLAKIDLGNLRGQAGDHEAADATLAAAHAGFLELGDRINAARVLYERAQHYTRDREDYRGAAALLEQAVLAYEAEKAFEKKPPPEQALRAVRSAGALYLNRLSDPLRARAAYDRAYRYAQSEEERLKVLVDLSRVARRAGDFTAAADRVDEARRAAVKLGRVDLEIGAVTEAANIAWYQGDYRRGQDLCSRSLALIDTIKPDKPAALRAKRRSRIYALSVCGLLAMSRRDLSTATMNLQRARRLAESLGDKPEIATQYNNIGRVFLEFGKVDEAIESFEAAFAIDEALKDRFALAYDLRNLGTALSYKQDWVKAETALERGLQYAIEVQDANNELRARFALAELERQRGDDARARREYRDALPLAENLDVKEIAWQIHRALGRFAIRDNDLGAAESELKSAVRIVRSMTGRVAATDFGTQRYAAFDDLTALMLRQERIDEAFEVADIAHRLEASEVLEDGRISFSGKDVPRLLREAREVKSATVAEAALARLERFEPQIARMLRPTDRGTLGRIPAGTAVVFYRVTDDALSVFVIDDTGVRARRTAIAARELTTRIREYGRQLSARAELSSASDALAEVLIDPIRDLIATKTRLAIVPHRVLHYVPFSALPFGSRANELMIDRFVTVLALDASIGASALAKPLGALIDRAVVALGAPSGSGVEGETPLPFAKRELEAIREALPATELVFGPNVTRSAFLSAFSRAPGVVHFAGHSRLGARGEGREGFVDALGSELRLSDGPVTLFDVLANRTRAELVVLSACSSLLAPTTSAPVEALSGDELLSLAQGFAIAGARYVMATTMHVNDVAAAALMKRFYREARSHDVAAALRDAQQVVRRHFPHPAWWATFSMLAGSS